MGTQMEINSDFRFISIVLWESNVLARCYLDTSGIDTIFAWALVWFNCTPAMLMLKLVPSS